ncbi:hypothetical protein LTR86_003044 [Recurvomyces mirabilis]|nr:hypothetical protein LTR86_003044 [Recurvomyces mirabilis]
MELYNGQDLLEEDVFNFTVIEDQKLLDRASTLIVRQHFNQWSGHALPHEQGPPEEIAQRRQGPQHWLGPLAVRYKFCIQIDGASLQSLVDDGLEGWMKLVYGAWRPQGKISQQDRSLNTDDLLDPDGVPYEDEEYEEIGGCAAEDVGWMRVECGSLMPSLYANLHDVNAPPYVRAE